MSTDPSILDPLALPLDGRALIEASAGTGKTWTLAALYVRLVLGHGDTIFPQGLMPEQILVLTFTRAATRELRQRIRARLAEVADLLAGKGEATDDFAKGLLAAYPDTDSRHTAARRCLAAARTMDKAAIHTIHGFCQRALKRFAFASGLPFELELPPDESTIKSLSRHDYWRRFILPLPPLLAGQLMAEGIDSPAALQKKTDDLQLKATPQQSPFPETILALEARLEEIRQHEKTVRTELAGVETELFSWLSEKIDVKQLLPGTYRPKNKTQLEPLLGSFIRCGKYSAELEKFTPAGLVWRKGKEGTVPEALMPALQALDTCVTAHGEAAFPVDLLCRHYLDWTTAETEKQLEQQAQVTFDTMVTWLDRALAGDGGAMLAQQLFDTWPAALVDEFQDTDPVQYRIFRHIYHGRTGSCWLMIGDPKQAIYGFRGADIHTYLAAARETVNRFTLGTNHRSRQSMVEAVNTLFATSPLNGEPEGPFGSTGIGFHPARAAVRDENLLIDGSTVDALTLCFPDDTTVMGATLARPALANTFADRVAALLEAGREGRAVIGSGDRKRPLKPVDIVLLVRNKAEAECMQAALAKRNVDSVYLSDKRSIFDTDEARDLLRLLQALADPADAGLLRAALAGSLMAFEPAELAALEDNNRWQQYLRDARQFHDLWQKRGPLAMLHRLAHQWQLPARQQSERVLTNLFHLAELLQNTSGHLEGIDAQLQWLENAIAHQKTGNEESEELLPRLESERELVRLMTLHGSKGLEFPVVVLPFVTLATEKGKDDPNELMRLLYVGLTRSRLACFVGLALCRYGKGDDHQLETSPLGRLLFGGQHQPEEAIHQRLAELETTGHITVDRNPPPQSHYTGDTPPPLAEPPVMLPVRTPAGWSVSSYSRLAQQRLADIPTTADEKNREDAGPAQETDGRNTPPATAIHVFAAGANTGNLLHTLLEHAIREKTPAAGLPALVARFHTPVDPSRDTEIATLTSWLAKLLDTPLLVDDTSFTLGRLDTTLCESEFWLAVDSTHLPALDRLAKQLLPGDRPPLPAGRLDGMLRGFIDLTFCHAGRYYVLDYKSNRLGSDDSAYTPERMREAMRAERYDLQALIYQQALHRLLRERLPDYDPTRHLGGCLYFFLRGVDSDSQGLVHLPAQPALLDAMEQLLSGEVA